MVRQFYIQLVGITCNPRLLFFCFCTHPFLLFFWLILFFGKWSVILSSNLVNMVILALSEWNPWAHWEIFCEWESCGGDWEAEGGKQKTQSQLLRSMWLPVWHVEWIPCAQYRFRPKACVSTTALAYVRKDMEIDLLSHWCLNYALMPWRPAHTACFVFITSIHV